VDHYKDFLPLCSHSHVWKDSIREGGRCFEADLVVGYASFFGSVFRTGYRSEVVVDPEQLTIETNSGRGVSVNNSNNTNSNYTDGDGSNGGDDSLFESLHSKWSLTPVAAVSSTNNDNNNNHHSNAPIVGTVVDFEVTMTVANPMVVAVLDTVLVRVAETQVAAFSERCRVVPPPTPEELERAERFYPTIGNQ
jgi:ribosome-associated toxin RatA of RatAB toxin-antitoxin module